MSSRRMLSQQAVTNGKKKPPKKVVEESEEESSAEESSAESSAISETSDVQPINKRHVPVKKPPPKKNSRVEEIDTDDDDPPKKLIDPILVKRGSRVKRSPVRPPSPPPEPIPYAEEEDVQVDVHLRAPILPPATDVLTEEDLERYIMDRATILAEKLAQRKLEDLKKNYLPRESSKEIVVAQPQQQVAISPSTQPAFPWANHMTTAATMLIPIAISTVVKLVMAPPLQPPPPLRYQTQTSQPQQQNGATTTSQQQGGFDPFQQRFTGF